MRLSEALEFADENCRELECLLLCAGTLLLEQGRYNWHSDGGVTPDLDVNHMINTGIMKIEDASKISILWPVYRLIANRFDIRRCCKDIDSLTIEDQQLLKILNQCEAIPDYEEVPSIRVGLGDGFY